MVEVPEGVSTKGHDPVKQQHDEVNGTKKAFFGCVCARVCVMLSVSPFRRDSLYKPQSGPPLDFPGREKRSKL